MVSDAKKCKTPSNAVSEEDKDLFSNLPTYLIHHILDGMLIDGMLINDAARMSVLSKTWRSTWETYPHLKLGRPFFDRLVYNKDTQTHRNKFKEAVDKIFLSRKGPVLKFEIYMPPEFPAHENSFTDVWMKQVSDRGIQYLKLLNVIPNIAITLPSLLFLCRNLKHLCLHNCILNPPLNFRGYHNLAAVELIYVTLTSDISFGAQIKKIVLIHCTRIEHLGSQFKYHSQNLSQLLIIRSKKREYSAVDLGFDPFTSITKSINQYELLGRIPSVTSLILDGVSLQFLDPGLALHKKLATDMGNLKVLGFYKLNFDCVTQISNAFCLIRSSPNLQILHIIVNPGPESMNPIKSAVELYLESFDCMSIRLDKLEVVRIHDVTSSRADLLLIKLLLANSPSLRRIILLHKPDTFDSTDEVRILQQLLQFPRKSPVQIFWSGEKSL